MKFFDNYQEHSYALLRIVSSFLFLWHGAQKFLTSRLNSRMGR
ncbi:MAG: hypothetical protein ACI9LU_000611 [Polaribacter sp.]|jgi:hypothetical protein